MYIMAQLNINQTPEFESDLTRLMRIRKLRTKSEAIRWAVKESLQRALEQNEGGPYMDWIGMGCGAGENPTPHFRDHSEVWT